MTSLLTAALGLLALTAGPASAEDEPRARSAPPQFHRLLAGVAAGASGYFQREANGLRPAFSVTLGVRVVPRAAVFVDHSTHPFRLTVMGARWSFTDLFWAGVGGGLAFSEPGVLWDDPTGGIGAALVAGVPLLRTQRLGAGELQLRVARAEFFSEGLVSRPILALSLMGGWTY